MQRFGRGWRRRPPHSSRSTACPARRSASSTRTSSSGRRASASRTCKKKRRARPEDALSHRLDHEDVHCDSGHAAPRRGQARPRRPRSSTYLPSSPPRRSTFAPIEGLTIRRMLSHESGLQSEPPDTDFTRVLYESDPAAKNARARGRHLDRRCLRTRSGSTRTSRYQLLGRARRSACSGVPYAEVRPHEAPHAAEDDVTSLDPLPAAAADAEGNRATSRASSPTSSRSLRRSTASSGAEGGLWSCVEDLARWLSCQFDPSPMLSEETAREMHKPRYLVDDAWTRAWAIGWYAVRREDVIWRMHSGGHYGFITNACFDPEQKVGAIALLNGFAPATLARDGARRDGERAVKSCRACRSRRPQQLPRKWRDLAGPLPRRRTSETRRSLEWRDGKLTFIDPSDPTWTPTLADHRRARRLRHRAGLPRVRASSSASRAARTGRVVSVNVAVATMQRLEPVGQLIVDSDTLGQLYSVEPDEFVAERKRLERSLRDEGRAEEAARAREAPQAAAARLPREPSRAPAARSRRAARRRWRAAGSRPRGRRPRAATHRPTRPCTASRRARPSRPRRSVRCHRAAARGAAQGSGEQSRDCGPATPRRAVGRGRAGRLRCTGGPDTEPAEDPSEARAQARAGARTQAGTSRRSSKAGSQRRPRHCARRSGCFARRRVTTSAPRAESPSSGRSSRTPAASYRGARRATDRSARRRPWCSRSPCR